MREILQFLGQAVKVLGQVYNHPVGRIVIQNLPRLTREVDSWINTRSYEKAQAKIRELEKHGVRKMKDVLERRRAQMSPEVAQAYEDALRRNGELP